MGEIADMMLGGTLCEGCGEYIGEGDGIPNYCSPRCAKDRGADWWLEVQDDLGTGESECIKCPLCGKLCKGQQGLQDHSRVVHETGP